MAHGTDYYDCLDYIDIVALLAMLVSLLGVSCLTAGCRSLDHYCLDIIYCDCHQPVVNIMMD